MKRASSIALALALALDLVGCVGASRPRMTPAPTPVLTLLTWNILHGADPTGELNLEAKADYIARRAADLVFLQEIDERCERSDRVDQMAALGRVTGMEPAFAAFMPYQGGRYGLGTLSALPVVATRVLRLPRGDEPRAALLQEVEFAGHRLLAVNVHFNWTEDDTSRFAQARALLTELEGVELPTIVAGDFNDVPASRTMRAFFAAGFVAVDPPGPSWNALAPTKDIDHLLVRHGEALRFEIVDGEVAAESALSDHRPVLGRVRLVPAS